MDFGHRYSQQNNTIYYLRENIDVAHACHAFVLAHVISHKGDLYGIVCS